MQDSIKLSKEDLKQLNSRIGIKHLLSNKKIDLKESLRLTKHELELRGLQAELVQLQAWTIENNKKIIIVFEGRDTAGKGETIRRIAAHINPRYYKIAALPKPTLEEQGQWYFQRYVNRLPKPGEIVFFDRSWYNRAVVEPVNGFCTKEQYEQFMKQVKEFEKMIIDSNTFLIKFYLSISKEEQASRFEEIKSSPVKKWRITEVDKKAQQLWNEYSNYIDIMLKETSMIEAPWIKIDANRKTEARIEAAKHILKTIPYK